MTSDNELIKAIDDAEAKVRAVRDMAVNDEQWWLYKPINKAVSSILGITEALLEQKAAQQTEQEASDNPTTPRQRRKNMLTNGAQSDSVLST